MTAGSAGDAPRLYDLLDVAPDANAGEIRAAWKSATADLDPSDRRFRAYNQAAELLLDPERRAAYDAQLAAAGPESPVMEESAPVEPVADTTSSTTDRNLVPGWLLIGLAVLTAAALGLAAWVAFAVPSSGSVEESTRIAQAAAERSIVPVLSYDAATLDESQEAGADFLTANYLPDYDQLYELIRQNAPDVGTVVTTEVVASGIVRSGEDRVEVLIFVNRPTTNKQQKEPIIYRDQVTVTMVRVGGSWLIDDLVTTPPVE